MGMPIPDLSNLPGVSRPGGGGPSGPSVDQIANQYSFEFDRAAGTYMTTGINIAADSNFSVSFWVKGNTGVTAYAGIFPFAVGSASNSTLGRMHPSGVCKFMIQSTDNTGANFGNRIIDIDNFFIKGLDPSAANIIFVLS